MPRYPDALAVVPMCVSVQGGEAGRVLLAGSGVAADLALRAAAEDTRIETVLAIGPALAPENVVAGLLLLREMNAVQAWRWYRRWSRRPFLASLDAREAASRLGNRAHLLVSPEDEFFHLGELREALPDPVAVRLAERASHEALVRDEAPEWLSELLES